MMTLKSTIFADYKQYGSESFLTLNRSVCATQNNLLVKQNTETSLALRQDSTMCTVACITADTQFHIKSSHIAGLAQ